MTMIEAQRNADKVAPWMIDWDDCDPICTDPPFDLSPWE